MTERIAVGTVALAALLAAAPAARASSADKEVVFPQGSEQPLAALQDIDVIEHLGERVPANLVFSDPAGRPTKLESLLHQGKAVLVTLGYHRCPMLCGLVLDGLTKALLGSGLVLGKDLLAVDISIDPNEETKLTEDTQKRVLAILGTKGAANRVGVAGLRPAEPVAGGNGDPSSVPENGDAALWPFWLSNTDGGAAARALADAVGFRYKYDADSKQFAHEAVAFVLTPEGSVARYLYGVEYPARDFRMAVVEASGGRAGTSLDKVVMSCFRYDPATRRYAPFVFGFVRIGALTVFFALATLLTVLWRKEIAMKRKRVAAAAGRAS